MCFSIKGREVVGKISNKDITVYKVFKKQKGVISSLYRNCVWEVGKKKRAVGFQRFIDSNNWDYASLNQGLHAKKTLSDAQGLAKRGITTTMVYECIIPAGTVYWENDTETCSEVLYIKNGKNLRMKK